ncbi:hypothetical protein GCM10023238_20700 [Streptomyces heliomycini]
MSSPRALGLPNQPVEATGVLLDALREGRERTVGLGLTSGTPGTEDEAVPARWFTFNAGWASTPGWSAGWSSSGSAAGSRPHALYMRQVVRQLLGDPHRWRGVITLEHPVRSRSPIWCSP